ERAMGFEPTTSSLGSWHSTAELRPRFFHYLNGSRFKRQTDSHQSSINPSIVVVDVLFVARGDGRRMKLATEQEAGPGDDNAVRRRQPRPNDDLPADHRTHFHPAAFEAVLFGLRLRALQIDPRPSERIEDERGVRHDSLDTLDSERHVHSY